VLLSASTAACFDTDDWTPECRLRAPPPDVGNRQAADGQDLPKALGHAGNVAKHRAIVAEYA